MSSIQSYEIENCRIHFIQFHLTIRIFIQLQKKLNNISEIKILSTQTISKIKQSKTKIITKLRIFTIRIFLCFRPDWLIFIKNQENA